MTSAAELAQDALPESGEQLVESAPGWSARLEIGLEIVAERSAVVHKEHVGPLGLQRAFYPESGGVAHLYLLHPPGGIVHGDELNVSVEAGPGAHGLITTPAATKFYRSTGRTAHQNQTFRVAEGATLEWLPQETIVFGSARVRTSTRVELEPSSRFCGWEIVCLGRHASGDYFESGEVRQTFELWQGQRPVFIERSHFHASAPVRRERWGLGGHSVFGTFVCTGRSVAAVEAARAAVAFDPQKELFAVSQLREVIVCRYLGDSTEQARAMFAAAWGALRLLLLERPASPPRVWLT